MLPTDHTEDDIKVKKIQGHHGGENDRTRKNLSKPIRTALLPFSVKAKSRIMEDETKRKGQTIVEFLINDRNNKFNAMGTWKFIKHITQDGRTLLTTGATDKLAYNIQQLHPLERVRYMEQQMELRDTYIKKIRKRRQRMKAKMIKIHAIEKSKIL